MPVYYFFLTRSIDDSVVETPICTESFLGDIGDFIEQDGVGYYIKDIAIEAGDYSDLTSNPEI